MSSPGPMSSCPTPLAQLAPRRVAVFRALQLGDMLTTVPALRALRAALPEVEIVLVGLPWARDYVAHLPHLLDGFRVFPGYPGLPEQAPRLAEIPGFLAALQAERFDLAIQLQGNGLITNPLTALFGARRTAAAFVPGAYCPDAELCSPYAGELHEIHRQLRVVEALGVPAQGDHLEFPPLPQDEEALEALAAVQGIDLGSVVVVHPGARNASRRWPPASFAAAADALAAQDWTIVLTGAPSERDLTRAVAEQMQQPAVDLGGRTEIGVMAALLRRARLLLCNNTGVCHLASALRTPSVNLFHSQEEIDRWAPLDRRRHRIILDISPRALPTVLAAAQTLLHPSALSADAACLPSL